MRLASVLGVILLLAAGCAVETFQNPVTKETKQCVWSIDPGTAWVYHTCKQGLEKAGFKKIERGQAAPSTQETVEPPKAKLEERLKELDDLKAQGKITEEEYAALRKKVIETFK